MQTILVAGPSQEPVSVAGLKAHLRLDDSEDTLLTSLIVAARMTIEAQSGLKLVSQSWRLLLKAWPSGPASFPFGPVQSVTSVEVPEAETRRLEESDYRLNADHVPPQLHFVGNNLPRLEGMIDGIRVNFIAGYGDRAEDVPKDLQLAVLHLAAHWYDVDDWAQCRGDAAMPPQVLSIVKAHQLARI